MPVEKTIIQEVIKYVDRIVEMEKIREVVQRVEIPVESVKIERVREIVEKIVEIEKIIEVPVGGGKGGGSNEDCECITEIQFVHLWNKLMKI